MYLDKGLVLYDSLCESAKDFELYVLCMDEKCYEVLASFEDARLKPIHLYDVENAQMLEAKSNRSMAEYCWTCSARLIQYILESYMPNSCTYIDADMYFYNDPQILIDEMYKAGKSVMMVPHRFPKETERLATKVGIYCVEFNCFKNDEAGRLVLNHWHSRCLECCSNIGDGVHWGDQKYMDEWPILFPDKVHVCEHYGAGVAPWNISLYKKNDCTDLKTILLKQSQGKIDLIFYHFQSVTYKTRKVINTGIMMNHKKVDVELVDSLYYPYLRKIEEKKSFLESKYSINTLIVTHPSIKSTSWIKKFLRKCRPKYIIAVIKSRMRINYPYIIEI